MMSYVILKIKQLKIVFFFEYAAVFAQCLAAVRGVLAVFRHFVDEKQGESFDAPIEVLLFLLKMGDDDLANLHATHVPLGDVALADDVAVGKRHRPGDGVDFRDRKAPVYCSKKGDFFNPDMCPSAGMAIWGGCGIGVSQK